MVYRMTQICEDAQPRTDVVKNKLSHRSLQRVLPQEHPGVLPMSGQPLKDYQRKKIFMFLDKPDDFSVADIDALQFPPVCASAHVVVLNSYLSVTLQLQVYFKCIFSAAYSISNAALF